MDAFSPFDGAPLIKYCAIPFRVMSSNTCALDTRERDIACTLSDRSTTSDIFIR